MDITRALRGKTIAAVMTNGIVLQIRTSDGAELNIAWVDDNGQPLKGKPTAARHGYRLIARGIQDLIALPNQINPERPRC